jgi:hypothetical protein
MPADLFKGVIGHTAVKQVLAKAVERPHGAYLIIAADGLGGHALAERFVRALADLPVDRPLATHPDIAVLAREMSDESGGVKAQISVESVRELRGRMSQRPAIAKRVVAHLPDAERLNEAGVNALLKSMEEPSAGAVYVLVAEDEARLPMTLKSRTAMFVLGSVSSKDIDAWLADRGVKADQRAEAVRMANGRPGWALRWLEDPEMRSRASAASNAVQRLLTSASLGESLAVIEPEAKRCDAADDSAAAWRETLLGWSTALRSLFTHDVRRALGIGQAIALAERHIAGPVSPRLWLELGITQARGETLNHEL